MDGSRFDALTRIYGRFSSRRSLLGGVVAVVASAFSADPGQAARCKGNRRRCARHRDCCSRICRRKRCAPRPVFPGVGGPVVPTCGADQQRCGADCIPKSQCCPNQCPEDQGQECRDGTCCFTFLQPCDPASGIACCAVNSSVPVECAAVGGTGPTICCRAAGAQCVPGPSSECCSGLCGLDTDDDGFGACT